MQNRSIWKKVRCHLDSDKTVVITGPRRVGKTTTLHWALKQLKSDNTYYIDLENVINRDLFLVRDYSSLINEFQNLGLDTTKRMYVAIDEIQHVKNLPSIVKYLQDNYDIKFYLSGSSSYYLKNHFSESLSGRKVIIEIFPLTFTEFLVFQKAPFSIQPCSFDTSVAFNLQSYTRLRTYYEEYIEYGGLPSVVLARSHEDKREALEDAYSSYINIDIQTLSDFKALKEFRTLVSLLSSRIGCKTNTSELASILGISRITVESYIEFMKQTYLIRSVPAFSGSVDRASRKQEKIYFVDTGIANITADLSAGAKFENSVVNQLAYVRDISYYEHRTKEIDLILDGLYALEIKQTPSSHDLRILQKRAALLDVKNAFLVGRYKNASFSDYLWGGNLG